VLRAWAEANIFMPEGPKLTTAKKAALAQYAGKTLVQVANAFTNFRNRRWKEKLLELRGKSKAAADK